MIYCRKEHNIHGEKCNFNFARFTNGIFLCSAYGCCSKDDSVTLFSNKGKHKAYSHL